MYSAVVRLDESCPVKYGLRLSVDEKYRGVKSHLSSLCDIPASQLLIVDICGAVVRVSHASLSPRGRFLMPQRSTGTSIIVY